MDHAARIAHELATAESAWNDANEGKARVCARRAVALAIDAWRTRCSLPPWEGDAMAHLRKIQRDALFPLAVREAALRLTTTVTRRDFAPFTIDPIGDAGLIMAHLAMRTDEGR